VQKGGLFTCGRITAVAYSCGKLNPSRRNRAPTSNLTLFYAASVKSKSLGHCVDTKARLSRL